MKRLGRVLPLTIAFLLVLLLIGPLVIPVPPLKGTLPPEQLADPDSLFVVVDGLTVHYERTGEGEPVFVLLHGFGASVFSWREVMAPLSQLGTVVAFDRPAFGLTERPLPGQWQGENPYTTEAQVSLTLALMDKLGVPQAILVGNSAGGTIAMLTALRAPERVPALILVSPAVYGGGGAPSWVRLLSGLPQVRRIGPWLVRFLVARLEDSLPSAWHDPSKITPEVWVGYKKPLQAENWDRAFWEFTLAGRPQDIDKQLDRITLPTLVVTGDDDRWVPTAQSVRLSQELPNAELAVIPNCGHVPQEECPQEFMAAVTSFLAEMP
jgi:pimeloyl-ACP methyl ester carboxylesterase